MCTQASEPTVQSALVVLIAEPDPPAAALATAAAKAEALAARFGARIMRVHTAAEAVGALASAAARDEGCGEVRVRVRVRGLRTSECRSAHDLTALAEGP